MPAASVKEPLTNRPPFGTTSGAFVGKRADRRRARDRIKPLPLTFSTRPRTQSGIAVRAKALPLPGSLPSQSASADPVGADGRGADTSIISGFSSMIGGADLRGADTSIISGVSSMIGAAPAAGGQWPRSGALRA